MRKTADLHSFHRVAAMSPKLIHIAATLRLNTATFRLWAIQLILNLPVNFTHFQMNLPVVHVANVICGGWHGDCIARATGSGP